MYKVLKSYNRKAERRHEVSGAQGHGQVVPAGQDQLVPAGAWTRGAHESHAYETHEHYERKVQRVKKTRRERDSSRGRNVSPFYEFC